MEIIIINLPNLISFLRVLTAPFFLYALVFTEEKTVEIACILYAFGSLTDFFDGWIARKYHYVSNWGKFIDPLADKILTSAAFIAFVLLDIVELWMVIILLLRDFGTTILRLYAGSIRQEIKTSLFAKWKTLLQMIFIAYILILMLLKDSIWFDFSILGFNPNSINELLYSNSTYIMMLSLTILSLWTAIEYLRDNWRLFSK